MAEKEIRVSVHKILVCVTDGIYQKIVELANKNDYSMSKMCRVLIELAFAASEKVENHE